MAEPAFGYGMQHPDFYAWANDLQRHRNTVRYDRLDRYAYQRWQKAREPRHAWMWLLLMQRIKHRGDRYGSYGRFGRPTPIPAE